MGKISFHCTHSFLTFCRLISLNLFGFPSIYLPSDNVHEMFKVNQGN